MGLTTLNTNAILIGQPRTPSCAIAAANASYDGSGSLVTLYTHATLSSRFDYIEFWSAQATAAATSARIFNCFISDTAGANPRLRRSIAMAAGSTRSVSVLGATITMPFTGGLFLEPGQILTVTQTVYAGVQDLTHVFAGPGGNY